MTTDADVTLTRAFAWGVCIVGDADGEDVPTLGSGVVAASASCVVVATCHASDVDLDGLADDDVVAPALVVVRIRVGVAGAGPFAFDGVLDLASGALSIGDADEQHVLRLGVCRCRVQVAANEAADAVDVWVVPA